MPVQTVRQAANQVLEANGSQDTLVTANCLMMEYGVGLRSTSPSSGAAVTSLPSPDRSTARNQRSSRNNSAQVGNSGEETRVTRGANAIRQRQTSRQPSSSSRRSELQREERPVATRQDWPALDEDGGGRGLHKTDSLPQTLDPASVLHVEPPEGKMDSIESTQSNTGRSYDKYCHGSSPGHSLPTSADARVDKSIRSSSPRREFLEEDDIGAVRFDFANAGDTTKTVSPGQDDSGFVDFGSLAHLRPTRCESAADSPAQPLPETPAPPQNPFRHSRSQLLPTSQLFRGTQLSSPAKHATPTSSRPSPANFPNSISPNPVISSPLKTRGLRSSPNLGPTSSSEILPGTTSSRLDNALRSPTNPASTQNPVVPDSSHGEPFRKKSLPEPMGTYEPMHKSQERRATSEVRSDPISPAQEEEDDDDSIARRRRAKLKKKAALKQLTAINLPIKSDDIEVPSTNQGRRKRQPRQPGTSTAQCHNGDTAGHDSRGADVVVESQAQRPSAVSHHLEDQHPGRAEVNGELEPATEPMPSAVPELPRSDSQVARRDSRTEGTSNADAIPETSPARRGLGGRSEVVLPSELPVMEAESTPDFRSSPPAFNTRSRRGRTIEGHERAPSSTSTLSDLASTPPVPSSKAQENGNIGPDMSPAASTIVATSSPSVHQTGKRQARASLPKLKTGSAENLRHSARLDRRASSSTDELSRSMSATPTFEQSLRISRLAASRSASRSGRTVIKPPPPQRGRRLFDSMAFAISFQAKKPGESSDQYNTRMDFAATVETRIKQAGGRILEDGFNELFEVLPTGASTSSPASSSGTDPEGKISLTAEARSTGFTALIADGHSRKVKYMQALALGLPCIAPRWVTTCLERNELVDWAPYLLCAGQSTFLGDAIRSRTLIPYDVTTARLVDVLGQRAKLLEGSRILAVVKKALEDRKKAYIFLVRVLGASVSRVCSFEEARAELKAAEQAGRPFDWVYVDGKPNEEALFSPKPPVGGKKRKRTSKAGAAVAAAATADERPVKRVRTLTHEWVVQSLILGRLLEEGELQE